MGVTREQYLEALDIVETYHQQLRPHSHGGTLRTWHDMKVGDKIVFTKTLSKYVLLDKEYEVLEVSLGFTDDHNGYFTFKGENRVPRCLAKSLIGGYKAKLV